MSLPMTQKLAAQNNGMVKTCSIWRALEVVGDVPVLLILEAAWMGATRFNDLQKKTGLLKALLSNRLKRMIDNDLVVKRAVRSAPGKTEYALTSKGVDLFYTTLMLYKWERKWGTSKQRLNLRIRHDTCGAVLEPETVCAHCDDSYKISDVNWMQGEGVGWMPANHQRRRNQTGFDTDRPSLLKGSVELLGDRWAALVMRAIFSGKCRFDDILLDAGIAPNTLSGRLKKLIDLDVITARPYQTRPERLEYSLTRKGREYYNVIMTLMIWGDTYYASSAGPPVILVHKTCGASLTPVIQCGSCGDEVHPQDVSVIDD